MRLSQGFKEIFYFPFYFVSLNVAGLLSFSRFIRGTQPPMWKKTDRIPPPTLKNPGKVYMAEDCFGASYSCTPLNPKQQKSHEADELHFQKSLPDKYK